MRRTLFPADQDYLDLEPDPTPYVEAVARDAPALLARTRETPGVEVHGELGGVLEVSLVALVVEEADQHLEEIWVGFSMPPRGPIPPHPEWLLVALAALLPEAEPEELSHGGEFPRPGGNRRGEIVVRWQL